MADGFFHCVWVQELFKAFARYLSHLLVEGRSQGKGQGKAGGPCLKVQAAHVMTFLRLSVSVPAVKEEAKALIKKFFSRVQRCENEADWKHLKMPHGRKPSESKE